MGNYKILKEGKIIDCEIPGEYAGWAPGKIFGNLDCKSGMRMKKENRVFFHSIEDAVREGYRPCKNCKPLSLEGFEEIRSLIPQFANLQDFYDGDDK